MKTLTIRVTSGDIWGGWRGSENFCPIARALDRITKEWWRVTGDVAVKLEGYPFRYKLPRSARRFISRFDSGLPVKPFNFRIKIP